MNVEQRMEKKRLRSPAPYADDSGFSSFMFYIYHEEKVNRFREE